MTVSLTLTNLVLASFVVKKEDLVISRCKDTAAVKTNTETELEEVRKEFEKIYFDDRAVRSKVPDSTPTFSSPRMITAAKEPVFNQHQIPAAVEGGIVPLRFLSTPVIKNIDLTSKECPALRETIDADELANSMWKSPSTDFYKYIAQMGKLFGDVAYTQRYLSPLEGIALLSTPTDLCKQLFNQTTLDDTLNNPTCTMEITSPNTVITVKVGDNAKIKKATVLKVLPNVFVSGCDWPIMNTLKITDAAEPTSLDIMFPDNAITAVSCEDFSLKLIKEGRLGSLE